VFAHAKAPGARYGLIAGARRMAAARALGLSTIPAFLRKPADMPTALAAMASENEIRSPVSPWERARLIATGRDARFFPACGDAIDRLFAPLSRQKRSRLRAMVTAVEAFDGLLATPERLSEARLLRLAAALRAGWDDIPVAELRDRRREPLAAQWAALAPLIDEALDPEPDEAPPDSPRAPRRRLTLKQGLIIRRERTRNGWALRFSGPEARSPGLIDTVMDEIERRFGREARYQRSLRMTVRRLPTGTGARRWAARRFLCKESGTKSVPDFGFRVP
jgi:ParB family chromosome partitioning protein